MYFQGRQLKIEYKTKLFCSFLKRVDSKEGANSFLLVWTYFQKGLCVIESKQEFTKVVSLVKHGGQSTRYIHSSLALQLEA